MKNTKTQKGIMLVALIITIIILLILTVVAIKEVQGDGIITYTQRAKAEQIQKQDEEEIRLALNEWTIVSKIKEGKDKKFAEFMTEKLGAGNIVVENADKSLTIAMKSGNVYTVKEDGAIEFVGTGAATTPEFRIDGPGIYVSNSNELIKSWDELIKEGIIEVSDGVITKCNNKTIEGDLVIAEGITKINNSVFFEYKNLTDVTYPSTLKSIGLFAFQNCTGLTSFTIENSIEEIGALAFKNCTGLKEIRVNNSSFTIDIGNNPSFAGCTNIERVIYEEGVTNILGICCTSATDIKIPNSATTINDSAFSRYSNLTTIYIPDTVKSIGRQSFENCTGLTSFKIENSIEAIGMLAFKNCTGLKEIIVNNSNFTIDIGNNPSFTGCTSIERVIYEEGVTNIVGIGCTSATDIKIPNSVTTINNSAFSRYSNLTSIYIPDTVKSIGKNSFEYCTKLASITIPNSVKTIEDNAFKGCSLLTNITIPESIEYLGAWAFTNCTSISEIRIKSSNFERHMYAFSTCGGETVNLIYEEGVTNIVGIGCASVTSVSIPSTATTINQYAFDGYTKLQEVNIPSLVSSIGSQAFRNCTNLTKINIDKEENSISGYNTKWGATNATIKWRDS